MSSLTPKSGAPQGTIVWLSWAVPSFPGMPRATPAAPASARPLGPAGDAPLLMTSESTCTASRGPTHLPLHTPGHGGNYLHAPGISRSILHCQTASLHPAREPEQPEPTRA